MKGFAVINLFLWSFLACKTTAEPEKQAAYTFVAAGHVYGAAGTSDAFVYPPFLAKLDSLLDIRAIDLMVLMGDVVVHPTPKNWETVKEEVDALGIGEWHIAPGNHDISPYMDTVIQPYKYKAITAENNLFLILNTTHPGWTVDQKQQKFIEESLADTASFDRVFVFSHQLWWEKNPRLAFDLDSLPPNSIDLIEGEHDFWQDAFPYFENLDKEIYFLAGDMGCHYSLPGYYEDHFENFHFYGSGMGGGVEDNLLYIRIFQDRTVKIDRVDF